MLISDKRIIGNKLLDARKRMHLTQVEVAEASDLSSRTYADIERGTVSMRVETLLKICKALKITPNDILTATDNPTSVDIDELITKLNSCTQKSRKTASELLAVYLNSLE